MYNTSSVYVKKYGTLFKKKNKQRLYLFFCICYVNQSEFEESGHASDELERTPHPHSPLTSVPTNHLTPHHSVLSDQGSSPNHSPRQMKYFAGGDYAMPRGKFELEHANTSLSLLCSPHEVEIYCSFWLADHFWLNGLSVWSPPFPLPPPPPPRKYVMQDFVHDKYEIWRVG